MTRPHSRVELTVRVRSILEDAGKLDSHLPILVGFSGGPDSLCLLGLLAELGWKVTAAHYNHHLRAEADADAEQARRLAGQIGAPFLSGEGDVLAFSKQEHLSIEEAARTLRYRFLFDCARRLGAQAVAVGHTADDQVETVLMHLLRGAGLAGLKGMLPASRQEGWDASIPLVRPLLNAWRSETEGYCRERGWKPILDASNADPKFYRNRLRHELIPYLETYNPKAREVLLRSAEVLASEHAVVETAIDAAWLDCARESGTAYLAFERERLLALSPGLLSGLLRRAIAQLRPGLRDIDLEDVRRAVEFAVAPSRSGSAELAAGLNLFVEEGRLYLEEKAKAPLPAKWPQMEKSSPMRLAVPGELALENGWRLRAERLAAPDRQTVIGGGKDEAWLDGGELPEELLVRCARPGDTFQPLGLEGRSQKLSDLWINLNIPRRARASWPLVCSGEQVIWIAGLRAGHAFQITPSTRDAVRITLKKES